MNDSLLNSLKPSEAIDWENAKLRSVLLGTWTVVKWITIGFLTISLWAVWLILSIAFSELTEKGQN